MDEDAEGIPISRLPDEVLRKSAAILHSFSTGLVRLPDRPGGREEANMIGSGTFVVLDGTYGILTAHHVGQKIDLSSSIGLFLIEGEHKSVIRSQLLEVIEIARGSEESRGPDLSFVRLPLANAMEIRNYKQFFDLSLYRQGMLDDRPDPHSGVWYVCGIPDLLTEDEVSEGGFGRVKSYQGICGATGPSNEFTEGQFDYMDLDVEYSEQSANLPTDLGGYSGGGVWFVPLKKLNSGELMAGDYILAGVIFYQSPIENNKRFLRCHGPRSVYDVGYERILECS